jgi:hypothetical protein
VPELNLADTMQGVVASLRHGAMVGDPGTIPAGSPAPPGGE